MGKILLLCLFGGFVAVTIYLMIVVLMMLRRRRRTLSEFEKGSRVILTKLPDNFPVCSKYPLWDSKLACVGTIRMMRGIFTLIDWDNGKHGIFHTTELTLFHDGDKHNPSHVFSKKKQPIIVKGEDRII